MGHDGPPQVVRQHLAGAREHQGTAREVEREVVRALMLTPWIVPSYVVATRS